MQWVNPGWRARKRASGSKEKSSTRPAGQSVLGTRHRPAESRVRRRRFLILPARKNNQAEENAVLTVARLLLMILLCFPMQAVAKQFVEGTTFVSTRNPTCKIHLSQDFLFQGVSSEYFSAVGVDPRNKTTQRVKTYIFIDPSDQAIERFVVMETAKLPMGWVRSPYSPDPDDYLATGSDKFGGYEFVYGVYTRAYAEGCFAKRFATKCGLELGDYYILKDYTAKINQKTRMYITYAQRLTPEQVSEWWGMGVPESFVKKFLKDFEEAVNVE